MRSARAGAVGVVILLSATIGAIGAQGPLREARSENGRFTLQIDPGRPGRTGRSCQAALYEQTEPGRRPRRLWERPLVNDAAPELALIRNDGRFVVTLDEYRRGGARHAVVIYGAHGELLRHFLLTDLLDKGDWSHVKVQRRHSSPSGSERPDLSRDREGATGRPGAAVPHPGPSGSEGLRLSPSGSEGQLIWLQEARLAFDERAEEFVIELAWERRVRIDLRNLRVVRDAEQGVAQVTVIPAEILAQLFEHSEESTGSAVTDRLAELAGLTPDELARAEAIAQQLSTDESQSEVVAAEDAAAAGPHGEEGPAQAPTDQPAGEPTAALSRDTRLEAGDERMALPPPTPAATSFELLLPPPPDPANKVDYVAWMNELGAVDGPDATPVYAAAVSQFVPWAGEEELLVAAERGEPGALLSPEVEAWLDANAAALATFRDASHYPTRGSQYHSGGESVMEILLPDLSPLRSLAKMSIMDGRRLVALGRPAEAAARYLDVLSAGAHYAEGLTLIENLVGQAVQGIAADGLVKLAADPVGEDLDYGALAAEVEAAFRPPRPVAEAIQGERTFYLDAAQRTWDIDAQTGDMTVNMDWVKDFFSAAGVESDVDLDTVAERLTADGYEQTVAVGNAYYDALTTALTLPFPEAKPRIDQIESLVHDDATNPFLRHLTPSLERYNFMSTRSEATRRATRLVTNLKAYRQQHGEYPPSLAPFGEREFAVDPFSNTSFVYRRVGDDFVLYSVGGNLVDDAGAHDRKGDSGDLRYWPPPGWPR